MRMQEQINEDIKLAMKRQESAVLRVLRQLKNALSNAALNSGNVNAELADIDVLNVIRKQVAQRQDSIDQFTKGNRPDLVMGEEAEMAILKQYLPAQLSDIELDIIVSTAILELKATSKRDMGKVIKAVADAAQGKADNKRISQRVGKLLP